MPLFKRKPYVLRKPPKDLAANEDVFQVRFTKEIFRDYTEYLSCMKFYRRRVWTCKVSGKTNLTYEEALVSERKATEKVQQFPKEFMGPVLHMVQFSPLRIDELVDRVYKVFKERFVPGEEITGVREEILGVCRILKVFDQEDDESPLYEVAWLDEDGKKKGTSQTVAENLRRKKQPFSRALLKAFIRESASSGPSRNSAWFVHDKLARKYKIPIQVPERLRVATEKDSKRSSSSKKVEVRVEAAEVQNGVQGLRKRRRSESSGVRKKSDGKRQHVERVIPQPIRYPIEDTQVKPSASDSPLTDRPVPATDFVLRIECTGNLLMVWDFCCLFGKALLLSPFSLEDLEKSLDYREGEAPLLLEMTHALLRAALTDPILKDEFQHKRKRRMEITMTNWKDGVCDFLELPSQKQVTSNVISMIRQGYYKQVKGLEKLNILQTLVNNCLNSATVRNQIDEKIGEYQLIVAQKKEVEVEEVKRRKEEKELLKQQRTEQANGRGIEDGEQGGESFENGERDDVEYEDAEDLPGMTEDSHPTGWKVKGKRNSFGNHSPVSNGVSGKKEAKEPVSVSRSRQVLLKKKVEKKLAEEKEKEKQRIEDQKKLHEKRKEQAEALAERKLQEQKVAERQKKHEQLDREMEKHYIRTTPLGKDRFHNRFWFFNREGRLFVESDDSARWGYYSAKEELDALISSLNVKGIREKSLHKQLEKYYVKISNALQKRSKDLAQRYAVEEASVRRSERVRTAPRLSGFLAYVNKLRTT